MRRKYTLLSWRCPQRDECIPYVALPERCPMRFRQRRDFGQRYATNGYWRRRLGHGIKLIKNVSHKISKLDAFCIYLCVALSSAPISFSNAKSLTIHGRDSCAYYYNRYCCLYALLPNWSFFSCLWSSNAMICNVYMMTRRSSRGYIRRSSHNSSTKITPNWYGFIYCI